MPYDINIDLPDISTAKQLAELLQTTEAALAQDRYCGQGVPFIRIGRRVRYLKSDVLAFLAANRDDRTSA